MSPNQSADAPSPATHLHQCGWRTSSQGCAVSIGSGVFGVQALTFGADSTEGAPGSSLASHGGCLSSCTRAGKPSRIFPVSGYILGHSWPHHNTPLTSINTTKPLASGDQGFCLWWSCRDLNPGPPSSCQGFSVRSSRRISARLSGSDEHVPDDEPSRQ